MQNKKKLKFIITCFIVFSGFLISLLGILYKGLTLDNNNINQLNKDHIARNFEIKRIDTNQIPIKLAAKENISLNDLKGHPVIINFWASWCMTCRAEAHVLESFWQKHKKEGIIVVGIAVHDSIKDAIETTTLLKKSYFVGLDVHGNASINYGVIGVPETYFINKNGIVINKHVGELSKQVLEKNLLALNKSYLNKG